jgi:hypothetical protein
MENFFGKIEIFSARAEKGNDTFVDEQQQEQ